MQKYIEYALLGAILVVISYGVFAGGAKQFGSSSDRTTNLTALSLSEDLSVSGATAISGDVAFSSTTAVNQSTTTTFVLGTSNTGCLKMGNSNGSTTVPVYITVTGSTVTASTTKPGICK